MGHSMPVEVRGHLGMHVVGEASLSFHHIGQRLKLRSSGIGGEPLHAEPSSWLRLELLNFVFPLDRLILSSCDIHN